MNNNNNPENNNSWKLFETSGSVDDYMNYKKDEGCKPCEPCNTVEGKNSADNDNGSRSEGDKDR